MNDLSAIRLVNAIKKISVKKPSNNMLVGEIVSVDPLKIDIGNGIILTKSFLYLGQMCRPHKLRIPHTHKYNGETELSTTGITATTTATIGDGPVGTVSITEPVTDSGSGHKHEIKDQETDNVYNEDQDVDKEDDDYVIAEIYPALKEKDKVLLFAMNEGQFYYVAERIEE